MAEGGGSGGEKVRVVRCPRCQKLLPELANFSVYRCGGCDATLQAKRTIRVPETPIANINGERTQNIEVSQSDSEKKLVLVDAERPLQLSEASPLKFEEKGVETLEVSERASEMKPEAADSSLDAEHNGDEAQRRREESVQNRALSSHDDSATESEGSSIVKEPNTTTSDGLPKEYGAEISDTKDQAQCKTPAGNRSPNVNGLVKTDAFEGRETKQLPNRSPESQQTQQNVEENKKAPGATIAHVRPAAYPDEGPSEYRQSRGYQFGEFSAMQNMDGPSRVGYLEQNRAELLRMLDELRDQVQRTCRVTEKPKASDPMDRKTTSNTYGLRDRASLFPESLSSLNRNPSRRSPLLHDHSMLNYFPNVPVQNDMPVYPDPLSYKRAPFHLPGEYPQRQVDNYLYGQFDPDPILPYHHEGFYHQPTCSCLHCYQRQFSVPARGPATVFGQQRVPYFVNNHKLYPSDAPSVSGTRSSNTRVGTTTFHSLEQRAHHRTIFSKNAGTFCQPFAGAAPFTICYNCFELLQLPENSSLLNKNQFKLCCGSCSEVILVRRDGSRLVVAAPAPVSHGFSENSDNYCDSPLTCIQSTDEKLVLPYIFNTDDHEMIGKAGLILSDSEKGLQLPLSSTTSGNAESPESVISQKEVPASLEIPLEAQVISRVPSLPLREHFEYSPSGQAVDRSGHGSRSKRPDQERNISLSGNFNQNSAKDLQMATEMDVPENEYPPAGLSQDSWDMISKDEVQSKVVKAGDSFLAGLIKKSFKFNQSMGHGRHKVSINGHPIPDRLAKKAEKQAGPIYPGDYWYDYRAGFWGVMGHQCLGIIPPFIEEFNYTMPKNCSGGTTSILVNGRELHKKDLELLVDRGLPDTRGCSYIIDISGKVWDESSGEELDSLGKLAPTVERLKRGFGMRYPRA